MSYDYEVLDSFLVVKFNSSLGITTGWNKIRPLWLNSFHGLTLPGDAMEMTIRDEFFIMLHLKGWQKLIMCGILNSSLVVRFKSCLPRPVGRSKKSWESFSNSSLVVKFNSKLDLSAGCIEINHAGRIFISSVSIQLEVFAIFRAENLAHVYYWPWLCINLANWDYAGPTKCTGIWQFYSYLSLLAKYLHKKMLGKEQKFKCFFL